jgi:hypothetical protein
MMPAPTGPAIAIDAAPTATARFHRGRGAPIRFRIIAAMRALMLEPADARDTDQRRFDVALAHAENRLGIELRRRCRAQHGLVAGPFALVDQTGPDPPDHRVKPEDRFDSHVHRGREVVLPPDVAQLMNDDGLELGRREVLLDPLRHQQDGP